MGSEVKGISLLSTYFAPPFGSCAAKIDAILPGPEQARLMGLSFSQIDRLERQYLITDVAAQHSDIDYVPADKPVNCQLTLEILRKQQIFFKQNPVLTPFIVCDTDLLFFKSVSHLFEKDFDIALTKRSDNKKMPFNSGIFFVNNRNPHAAYQFWALKVQTIERHFMSDACWYGDQLVLTKIMDEYATPLAEDLYEVDGLKILLLDGDEYNFSPPRDHSYLCFRPKVHVYHFKGRSRAFMEYFYRFYVSAEKDWFFTPLKILFYSAWLELKHKQLKKLFTQSRERLSPVARPVQ